MSGYRQYHSSQPIGPVYYKIPNSYPGCSVAGCIDIAMWSTTRTRRHWPWFWIMDRQEFWWCEKHKHIWGEYTQ